MCVSVAIARGKICLATQSSRSNMRLTSRLVRVTNPLRIHLTQEIAAIGLVDPRKACVVVSLHAWLAVAVSRTILREGGRLLAYHKLSDQMSCMKIQLPSAKLAASAMFLLTVLCAGCRVSSSADTQSDVQPAGQPHSQLMESDMPAWGAAGVSWRDDGEEPAILIAITLQDKKYYPELIAAARVLARHPHVVSVGGRSVNLEEPVDEHAVDRSEHVGVLEQSHDPALHRVNNKEWFIRIPISDEVRQLIESGMTVDIFPGASHFAHGSLNGLRFSWRLDALDERRW